MKNRKELMTPTVRKLVLSIVIVLLTAVLIGFGAVYTYYSTGNCAEDPKGFNSIRGLNNAEDLA